MSSFFDKAKDKATQLANQAKEKVDDSQNKRKADDLLDDIGRIIYRQRTTGTVEPEDETNIEALVADLKALADQGTDILGNKSAPAPAAPVSNLPPPPAPGGSPSASAEPASEPAPMPMPMPMPEPQPGNG